MNRIFVVDDDRYIRELVCTILQSEGFLTFEAVDGKDALLKIDDVNPELCIVDIMMPNMDGFELCQQLRRYYESIPILMLTAKSAVSQKVKGFEVGTDDYLTKPFEAAELVARVKALLKRYKINTSKTLQIGTLVIDKNSYTITQQNEKAAIPMKEFELLFQLGANPGRTISRSKLIEDIWGFDFDGNERTLDVHINRLRDRFPSEQFHFKIVTVRGLGYRLEEFP